MNVIDFSYYHTGEYNPLSVFSPIKSIMFHYMSCNKMIEYKL